MKETFNKIRQWGEDKNIIHPDNSFKQLAKLMEENGELARALINKDEALFKDSIGDCVVVLTLLAYQQGLNIEDCIEAAYNEIKDRKGESKDGVFVKEDRKDCITCKHEFTLGNEEPCLGCLNIPGFKKHWEAK